jgi:CheY-like chemotaxis protein
MKPVQREQPLILVVDDEQAVLEQVSVALNDSGFLYYCCMTPEAAIAAAALIQPDLILADTNLHGVSGLETCERIKQQPAAANVPVMFLSAAQTPDIIRRSDGLHGTYYVRKPFDPDVLVELIDKALGRSRLAAATV